jgi:hypothetical protein
MRGPLVLPLLGLFAAACPWPGEVEIRAPATYRPGEPLRFQALVSFPPGAAGASGRGHLALYLPPGWEASGSYRLGERSYSLHPAPVVSAHYAGDRPRPGARWVGFVSFLHTGLPAATTVTVELTLRPPDPCQETVLIGIAAGMAPPYPGWNEIAGAQRSVTLRPAP